MLPAQSMYSSPRTERNYIAPFFIAYFTEYNENLMKSFHYILFSFVV